MEKIICTLNNQVGRTMVSRDNLQQCVLEADGIGGYKIFGQNIDAEFLAVAWINGEFYPMASRFNYGDVVYTVRDGSLTRMTVEGMRIQKGREIYTCQVCELQLDDVVMPKEKLVKLEINSQYLTDSTCHY